MDKVILFLGFVCLLALTIGFLKIAGVFEKIVELRRDWKRHHCPRKSDIVVRVEDEVEEKKELLNDPDIKIPTGQQEKVFDQPSV